MGNVEGKLKWWGGEKKVGSRGFEAGGRQGELVEGRASGVGSKRR